MTLPLPDFITFTGLDAWTDLERVEDISRRYPVEWGILFSPKRQGVEPRYPAWHEVARLVWFARLEPNITRLSAHLCGGYAREVVAEGASDALWMFPRGCFSRIQVNTSDPEADPVLVRRYAQMQGATGILQARGFFPNTCEVDWLEDQSGGRGELPRCWPSPERGGPFIGYAGGLGPETIGAALPAIQATLPPGTPYWIDMESRVRTADRLDLDKCEAVCRSVYGRA